MSFHLNVTWSPDAATKDQLDRIEVALSTIIKQEIQEMATLDDAVHAQQAEDVKVDALLQGYKDLAAAIAAAANDPAKIQAIVDDANAKAAAIDAVLNPPVTGTQTP